MKNADPNQLDLIIDGALSRYAGAEPLAGIAERVLNRIAAADPGRRTSKILAWAMACPMSIALMSLAIALWLPRAIQLVHIDFGSLPHVGPPSEALVTVRRAAPQPRRRIARRPFDSPITSEERTLLALVASHPAELQQIFADLQRRNEEPVEIHEIQILPLQIPEVQ